MNEKLRYQAFGLTIGSDIYLPELQQDISESFVDVEINYSELTNQYDRSEKDLDGFAVQGNIVLFKFPEIGIFCVQDGKRIEVSPISKGKEGQIRLLILGTCMGIILMQRRILPLHGSVIAINNKAYAIVGDAGAGKSTLASAFIQKGYKLLSDDVIAVSFNQEVPYVIPSYPQQKLWDSSLEQFGMDPLLFHPLYERETKYSIPVDPYFIKEKIPLAGVFELSKKEIDKIKLKKVTDIMRIKLIYEHTYRNFLLNQMGLLSWHFNQTIKIVNFVDLYRIERPIDKFTAYEMMDIILKVEGGRKNDNTIAFSR